MQTTRIIQEILDQNLNVQSGLPLYIQLTDFFKKEITNGKLKNGDRLPSEPELCKSLNISRSTVRKVFEVLEQQGLVTRERGRGTFISAFQNKRTLENIYSFTKEAERAGLKSESELLSFEKTEPDAELLSRFTLQKNEQVYKIVRLRKVNGEPFMIETVLVPEHFCPGLTGQDLYQMPLYRIMQEIHHIVPQKATELYRITAIDQNEAHLLQCPAGTGAFFVQRISEDQNGEIFEHAISLVRGDRCSLSAEIKKNKITFARLIDDK